MESSAPVGGPEKAEIELARTPDEHLVHLVYLLVGSAFPALVFLVMGDHLWILGLLGLVPLFLTGAWLLGARARRSLPVRLFATTPDSAAPRTLSVRLVLMEDRVGYLRSAEVGLKLIDVRQTVEGESAVTLNISTRWEDRHPIERTAFEIVPRKGRGATLRAKTRLVFPERVPAQEEQDAQRGGAWYVELVLWGARRTVARWRFEIPESLVPPVESRASR